MTMCRGSITLLRSSADHPTPASFEDERSYQLHLAASGAGVPTLNQSVSTLRFFFRVTLARADAGPHDRPHHCCGGRSLVCGL
jgi:hypothetical protein